MYKEVVDKKNCLVIFYMCKLFVYYCVWNKEKNVLIELCVLYFNFIGNRNNLILVFDFKFIYKYIWIILNENGLI